ncbi:hypothetical protein FDK12_03935 [Arthrobacter sp. NamB2]|uniref:hypothetical protein n=1 Tax=Arthrobacter sp. NamB2 TaxID=2576035 RepID=UPI0010C9E3DA|nr:hypothetical protein [Arthrobacter sp. NamB2]TKV28831.1 hypothetical protein FDK12_03935 [Arthrobacter sp. NamB2]
MSDDTMAALPADQLLLVVTRVLENTSPFADEAQLVASEILRLRDAGQLSQNIAEDLASRIYQRQMHSWHSGDFQLTEPIAKLSNDIDPAKREHFPGTQVDPVHVQARVAAIAAGIPSPTASQPGGGQDEADLLVSIARAVEGSVQPGWSSLRFRAWAIGNVMSYELLALRNGKEERSIPAAAAVYRPLKRLKTVGHVAGTGTWLSLTLNISSFGGLDVDYNFDDRPHFDIDISTQDYALELQRFRRRDESIPAWWRERIARGD